MSTAVTEVLMPEVVVPKIVQEPIPALDLSEIESRMATIRFRPMLELKAVDEETSRQIAANAAFCQRFGDDARAAIKPTKETYWSLHKATMGVEKLICELPDKVVAHGKAEHRKWEAEKQKAAEELTRRQNEENERRASMEMETWQQAYDDALAAALPFEEDEIHAQFKAIAPRSPQPVQVIIAQAPEQKGYQTRGKALTVSVEDTAREVLIKTIAAKLDEFPFLVDWLDINLVQLKEKAKQSEAWMEQHFPMVTIKHEAAISYRDRKK